MPLESSTTIDGLNPANPVSADELSQGDDHIRLIKTTLKGTFPNFTGNGGRGLQSTEAALDAAVADSQSAVAQKTFPGGGAVSPGMCVAGDSDTGIYSSSANTLGVSVGGANTVEFNSDKSVAFAGSVSASTGGFSGPGTVPVGMPCPWLIDTLPNSAYGQYQWMNGQAISRTNTELFSLIGINYGPGDGSTTFNLPDWREIVPVGKSTMGGTGNRGILSTVRSTLGGAYGEELHQLTSAELASHSHAAHVTDSGHVHGLPEATGGSIGSAAVALSGATGSAPVTQNTNSATTGVTVSNDSTGGDTAHNNMQPYTICNWVIRIK